MMFGFGIARIPDDMKRRNVVRRAETRFKHKQPLGDKLERELQIALSAEVDLFIQSLGYDRG